MKNNYISKDRSLLFFVFYLTLSSFFANALTSVHVLCTPVNIQQSEIHGSITDTSGMPLAGVHITVQATKRGVVSNFDGTYSIVANSNDTLVFSALGFVSQAILVSKASEINIQLQEDITQLDTVTLNAGYGWRIYHPKHRSAWWQF